LLGTSKKRIFRKVDFTFIVLSSGEMLDKILTTRASN
jgi:hypothetical protein